MKDLTRSLTWIEQAAQTLVPVTQMEQYVEHSSDRPTRDVTITIATNRAPAYDEVLHQLVASDGSAKNVSQLLTERQDLLCHA